MKRHIGIKVVNAVPMALGDYNKLQGWQIPEDQDQEAEGYLVEYLDGGKANHKDYEGYISWSPKDVFERSYHEVSEVEGGIMQYFAYKHLSEHLQKVSKPIGQLAEIMDALPDGPEKSAGLRKLLEAKDCFVRAKLS